MTTLGTYNVSGCFGELPAGNIGEVLVQKSGTPGWGGANLIKIADVGNFFPVDNVESALQHLATVGGGGGGGGLDCDGVNFCLGDLTFGLRPWAEIGGTSTPNSHTNVPVGADIYHLGNMVRGSSSSVNTGASLENVGSMAIGQSNAMTSVIYSLAIGLSNTLLNDVTAHHTTGDESLIIGNGNQTSGPYSLVSGYHNLIGGEAPIPGNSIIGGQNNTITSPGVAGNLGASIIGGDTCTVTNSDNAMIAASFASSITNSDKAVVLAGSGTTISNAPFSFAVGAGHHIIGENGIALGEGCALNHSLNFMYQSWPFGTFSSVAAGQFSVSAFGGVRLRSDSSHSIGVDLAAGASSWTSVSAEALKGEFANVDPLSILAKLVGVPIRTYRFKKRQATVRGIVEDGYHDHVNFGPTAEAWNSAFADLLGEKAISDVVDGEEIKIPAINDGDKLGVALAAIQGLASMVNNLKQELDELRSQVSRKGKTKLQTA